MNTKTKTWGLVKMKVFPVFAFGKWRTLSQERRNSSVVVGWISGSYGVSGARSSEWTITLPRLLEEQEVKGSSLLKSVWLPCGNPPFSKCWQSWECSGNTCQHCKVCKPSSRWDWGWQIMFCLEEWRLRPWHLCLSNQLSFVRAEIFF